MGLAWIGFHAPGAAAELFGAAALTLGWAVVADGPLGIVHVIRFRLHRAGLVVIGVALVGLPLATGTLGNLAVTLPCVGAAFVLLRVAMIRWPASTATPTSAPAAATKAANTGSGAPVGAPLGERSAEMARNAGRAAARAGTLAGRTADVTVPRGARIVGRAIGRSRGHGRSSGPDDKASSR